MSPPSDLNSAQQYAPPKWSALAITAFICSLVGFLGFTAVLGIILGIAGIAVTRNEQRRGRGLAIAALPISMITGLFGFVMVYGGITFWNMYKTSEQLVPVLSAPSDQIAAGADTILKMSSKSFQGDVPRARLEQWLTEVNRKHGNLAKLERDMDVRPVTTNPNGQPVLNIRGKFTNGPALIRIAFVSETFFEPKLDDIEIDGVAVRTEPED